MRVTRSASPPSAAETAKTSPRTTKASFLPSGDSASSSNPLVRRRNSAPLPAGTPRSAIGTARTPPLPVSSVQIPKSRSKTIVPPSRDRDGQSTRPESKCVNAVSRPSRSLLQRFSAPPRSDMKAKPSPSGSHIGHSALAPRSTMRRYPRVASSRRSQISDSSRWLWPLRHHWAEATPRTLIRRDRPSGEGAASNSFV